MTLKKIKDTKNNNITGVIPKFTKEERKILYAARDILLAAEAEASLLNISYDTSYNHWFSSYEMFFNPADRIESLLNRDKHDRILFYLEEYEEGEQNETDIIYS